MKILFVLGNTYQIYLRMKHPSNLDDWNLLSYSAKKKYISILCMCVYIYGVDMFVDAFLCREKENERKRKRIAIINCDENWNINNWWMTYVKSIYC